MKELELLLDQYWVTKTDDKDTYYTVKDHINEFKSFITDKLGYHLMVNPDVIKLEKVPGTSEPWMGINQFEHQMEYAFLCILLMFLENKGKEEQFVLSSIAEYIQANFIGEEKIDWTIYKQRRYLIKVIKFATNLGIIKVDDGDDQKFLFDESTEVLYESTGLSRYFVRNFTTNILNFTSIKDFENSEWGEVDSDKGIQRRHRVYRKLVMSPVVYHEGADDVDFDYIKKQRSFIENDLEKYLDYNLHVHKEAALIVLKPDQNLKDTFPNTKAISDITLLFNQLIKDKIVLNDFVFNKMGEIHISFTHFTLLVEELKMRYSDGWSKEYKEMPIDSISENLIEYMKEYKFLKYDALRKEVILNSLVGKITGQFPKDFLIKGSEEDE